MYRGNGRFAEKRNDSNKGRLFCASKWYEAVAVYLHYQFLQILVDQWQNTTHNLIQWL